MLPLFLYAHFSHTKNRNTSNSYNKFYFLFNKQKAALQELDHLLLYIE